MPEGDTIHKLARGLRPELQGQPIETLWLRDRGEVDALAGRHVREISVLGKHLLIGFGRPESRPAFALHVHLGMKGRFQRIRPGEPPRRPPWQDTARITTASARHVFTRTAICELLPAAAMAEHPSLLRLGPDLLAPEVSFDRVLARARRREPGNAADLLLDQGVACGIGNVYKSEVLFLMGVHPETPTTALSDATILSLFRCARRLMRRNLGGWRRTTLRRVTEDTRPRPGDPRFFVYGRAGRPCRRCGTLLRGGRVGDAARTTTWCPTCQPAPPSPVAPARVAARSVGVSRTRR
ncbi:MAG: DNA-formamidopyrimidine glycosylase family protein [Myxococcota bacterium]|nr:DNA-formamidopyrimidine glycosylase family protein [Myxococcota bacterium]